MASGLQPPRPSSTLPSRHFAAFLAKLASATATTIFLVADILNGRGLAYPAFRAGPNGPDARLRRARHLRRFAHHRNLDANRASVERTASPSLGRAFGLTSA